jgi:uncharacterized membrane protein
MRTIAIAVLATSLLLAVLGFSGWALLDRTPFDRESSILEFFCGIGVALSFVGIGVAIVLFAMLPLKALIRRAFQIRPPSKSN